MQLWTIDNWGETDPSGEDLGLYNDAFSIRTFCVDLVDRSARYTAYADCLSSTLQSVGAQHLRLSNHQLVSWPRHSFDGGSLFAGKPNRYCRALGVRVCFGGGGLKFEPSLCKGKYSMQRLSDGTASSEHARRTRRLPSINDGVPSKSYDCIRPSAIEQ
jgi:hypothetical protein